jgi:ADP-ribosyl-[dinitrogen reductase] hydrolase
MGRFVFANRRLAHASRGDTKKMRAVTEVDMAARSRLMDAFKGSLVADAAAMPVHWYYDTAALDRGFPDFELFSAPLKRHPDSILWRSKYVAANTDADILHEQAAYWGKREIHYHQFLRAGENTLNFRLATELYRQIRRDGGYDRDRWLETYVRLMRTRGWHHDTYVEEYHREFFKRRAAGFPLRDCGIEDIHIGGLAMVPALLAGICSLGSIDQEELVSLVKTHVGLTHKSSQALDAAEALARILTAIALGDRLDSALGKFAGPWVQRWGSIENLGDVDDRIVVGRFLTSACYLPDSLSASLWLCSKYRSDFEAGVRANCLCGGDNCHRGAVVGSVLGALNGVPDSLLEQLVAIELIGEEHSGEDRSHPHMERE